MSSDPQLRGLWGDSGASGDVSISSDWRSCLLSQQNIESYLSYTYLKKIATRAQIRLTVEALKPVCLKEYLDSDPFVIGRSVWS
jgi:hypothetical protein